MFTFRRLTSLAVAAALTAATATAVADDIEIYQSQTLGARPNVLFIVDTSGSMGSTVIKVDRPPYDPNGSYPDGGCSSDRIYFSSNGKVPSCGTDNYFSRTNNVCKASFADLTEMGGSGVYPAFGSAVRMAQFKTSGNNSNVWTTLGTKNAGQVECIGDEGIHGESDGNSAKWIWGGQTTKQGKTTNNAKWSTTNQGKWDSINKNTTYRLYSGKYLNYLASTQDPADITRMDIVKGVAKSLANSLSGVNLGLMRYGPPTDSGGQGGYILTPVGKIEDNRSTIINQINALPTENYTPLSETLYEAALYWQGEAPKFGGDYSAPSSMADGHYISPIKATCQKNYIIYLTDGAPTKDGDANVDIGLKTKTTLSNGACPEKYHPFEDSGYSAGNGSCMDELTGYLADRDDKGASMGVDLINDKAVKGTQTVQTYMIGFGDSITSSKDYLNEIAKRGGTDQAFYATDPPSLTDKLSTIFGDIQQDSGTFVTPSVAVNAFNRAQTSDDLYFSLFKVGKSTHWAGNLKKYKLLRSTTDPGETPQIVDVGNKPAVGADGLFAKGTTSFWSAPLDEGNVELGGAANEQLAPDLRPLYTSTSSNTIVSPDNALTTAKMSDLLMDTGTAATAGACNATCVATISWLRGFNIDVNNPDTVLDTTRKYMGDPLHGKPAVVSYDDKSTVVFVPTNDGVLHAIDASDGSEIWGYVPPELLPRLQTLRKPGAGTHTYGLDGDVRVLRMDKDQDGKIGSGDRVWLFFGMRAGGDHYYAIDVTDSKAPVLLWDIGPNELPNVGQTWSPPVVTRVNVGGTTQTDPEKFVLIFGGGYDDTQESQAYSADPKGNRIYMVEAKTGKLLWSAGGKGGTAPNLSLKYDNDGNGYEMNNSIPAPIRVIDTNGDGFADRLYAGDMGGRIWRFDIFNGKDPTNTTDPLVAGGIFAALGAGDVDAADSTKDNRRFYNAPDVSLIQIRGTEPFFNVAIGSGYRGHPLDSQTVEKFYSVRDMNPYRPLTQAQYGDVKPVLDSQLVDITTDPTGIDVTSSDKGWVLGMVHGSTTTAPGGEKVMSESTTVNNVILFTSFQPTSLQDRGDCYPTALNRVYALTAFGGKPAINFYDSTKPDLTNDDISTVLAEKNTIVGDVAVAVLRDDQSSINPPTVCLAGMEVLKKCVNVGGTIRTFWNRGDAK